jgi:hypothetical protein
VCSLAVSMARSKVCRASCGCSTSIRFRPRSSFRPSATCCIRK